MITLTKPTYSWASARPEESDQRAERISAERLKIGLLFESEAAPLAEWVGHALEEPSLHWIGGESSEWSILPDVLEISVKSPEFDAIAPTIQRIRSFAGLAADWDSYGAHPVSPLSIAKVEDLLVRSIVEPLYGSGAVVDAVPSPDGGLLVEWDSPSGRFQLHVQPDGTMAGVRIDVEDGVTVAWTDVSIATDRDVLDQLSRLA